MRAMAGALFARYEQYRDDDWEWCDSHLTYNNGRMPQALLLAGQALDEQRFVDCGICSLQWLVKIHTMPSGAISLVGNRGWWRKGGERAEFDQQRIDAAAVVVACKSAYTVNGEQKSLAQM